MTTSPPDVAPYRAKMQKRLDRGKRRFAGLRPLLEKNEESNLLLAQKELQAIEDDFSHIISEMQIVRYYFGQWCQTHFGQKVGNARMDKWQNARLNHDERRIWYEMSQSRDFDIHRDPVAAAPERRYLPLQVGERYLVLQTRHLIACLQNDDGSMARIEIKPFCEQAFRILQRFVDEFDQSY